LPELVVACDEEVVPEGDVVVLDDAAPGADDDGDVVAEDDAVPDGDVVASVLVVPDGVVVVVVVDDEDAGGDGGTTTVVDVDGGELEVAGGDSWRCWHAPSASRALAATAVTMRRFICCLLGGQSDGGVVPPTI
jgi:hypothetical protein